MLCEQCKKNDAILVLTTVIDGKRRDIKLCADCMEKHRQALEGVLSIGDLLSGFYEAPAQENGLVCPNCGQTYDQFCKTSLLGCAQCYKAFEAQLAPVLKRVHGDTQHAGKVPLRMDNGNIQRMRKIEEIKQRLSAAVAEEKYELAAELRDAVRALQGGENDG